MLAVRIHLRMIILEYTSDRAGCCPGIVLRGHSTQEKAIYSNDPAPTL